MNLRKTHGIVVVLLTCIQVSACSAGDPTHGEVSASIAEQDYHGVTLAPVGERQSSATFMQMGGMTLVNIQAHDLETGGMMDNVLALSLTLSGGNASAQVQSAEISYWPEGMAAPFYISSAGNVSVDIERFEVGNEGYAQGTFRGQICYQKSMFSAADKGDCRAIEGQFRTALVAQ
ncbi:hypothetical protein CWI80_10125 [Pseudidiomarina sediminum]|uniref:Lipoprotein n=1 Tax=Pseudidiomarina sediminum TaxID=431675 RepID=A0A432Z2M3_9GAMM|nr:hypothetical protein [Pseudidiomarina sediminum]RUO72148.1 hypothetical protein CWI80_10125 [Pseudidiomarina sediminum]